jgi:hypothetical protein
MKFSQVRPRKLLNSTQGTNADVAKRYCAVLVVFISNIPSPNPT